MPRLWTLRAAAQPSQLALIALTVALGVGMATAGPPLTPSESSPLDASSSSLLESVLVGPIALIPVSIAIHDANEYVESRPTH